MTSHSALFSGCLLPVNTSINKTFLELCRENDQARNNRFILPLKTSMLDEMSDIARHRGDMSDIWCPWENYSPDIEFIKEVSSLASIKQTLEKYQVCSARVMRL